MMTWLDPMVAALGEAVGYISSPFLPLPSIETEAPLGAGSSLILPPGLPSARRLQSGTYEPEVTTVIRTLLRPGMTFVDVGANVGYYTIIAARLVGETGRVYAFEPENEVFRYLELNAVRCAARNILALKMPVSDRRAQLSFVPSALERGFLSTIPATLSSANLVETISLDAFFEERGWPAVDVIKIDVEGAECLVLGGMSNLSTRNPNLKLIFEFNLEAMLRAGSSARDISDRLVSLGFGACHVIEQDMRRVSVEHLPVSRFVYNILVVRGNPPFQYLPSTA